MNPTEVNGPALFQTGSCQAAAEAAAAAHSTGISTAVKVFVVQSLNY